MIPEWCRERAPKRGFDWSPGGGSKTVRVGDSTLMYGISTDARELSIISLRTPAKKRRAGSARCALALLLEQADQRGIENVTLAASPLDKRTERGRLVGFYRSFGFEPTGRLINPAGDPAMERRRRA